MNKEQQRIAIAEACGWTAEQDSNGYWRAVSHKHGNAVELWLSERNVWSVGIPDYLNDLNAMHEAEKILNQQQARDYAEHLGHSAQDGTWAGCHIWYQSAAQRAEAFLKTLGLWKEEQ
jgi:hypothetical protein